MKSVRLLLLAAICCFTSVNSTFAIEKESCKLDKIQPRLTDSGERVSGQTRLPKATTELHRTRDYGWRQAYGPAAPVRSVDCPCGEDCKCPPGVCEKKLCEQNYVIVFTATWCGPCKRAHPHIEKLQKEGYQILFVDVDKHAHVRENFKIESIPTFVAFDASEEVDRDVGFSAANAAWFKWLKDYSKPRPQPEPKPDTQTTEYDL